MSDTHNITNDSIVLNEVLGERCNADRTDLLNVNFYGKVTFIMENGMIQDFEINKKRRVKR